MYQIMANKISAVGMVLITGSPCDPTCPGCTPTGGPALKRGMQCCCRGIKDSH